MARRKKKELNEGVDLFVFFDALTTVMEGSPFDFRWNPGRGAAKAKGFCPFHANTHTPAFSIYTTDDGRQRWHCFSEGIGGTAYDAAIHAMKVKNGCFKSQEEIDLWMESNGFMTPDPDERITRDIVNCINKFMAWCHELLITEDPESKAAGWGLEGTYFTKRHISPAALNDYPIGYYPRIERIVKWMDENKIPYEYRNYIKVKQTIAHRYEQGLVFGYTSDMSHISRLKLRNPAKEKVVEGKTIKEIVFLPNCFSSTESNGYFGPYVYGDSYADNIFLVEGEFDVLGMASTIKREDPQAYTAFCCFGGGSTPQGATFLDTHGFDNIIMFPDNDKEGYEYVTALSDIRPDTLVFMPDDIRPKEDPCLWAARHNVSEFLDAIRKPSCIGTAYEAFVKTNLADYDSLSSVDKGNVEKRCKNYAARNLHTKEERTRFAEAYCAIVKTITVEQFLSETNKAHQIASYRYSMDADDFGMYRMLPGPKSKEEYLANIVVTVDKELVNLSLEDNDDANMERTVILKAFTSPFAKPVIIKLPSADFGSDSKLYTSLLTNLGTGMVIQQYMGVKVLREALAVVDTDQKRIIKRYNEPGWHGEAFFMPNGFVDKDGWHAASDDSFSCGLISSQHGFASKYMFKEPEPETVERLKKDLRVLLEMYGPYEGLLILNHFLSIPVAHWYKNISSTALWLAATTGTGKTTLCKALMCMFGDFANASFETWDSSPTSIIESGYQIKDLPMIVDDFKPATTDPTKVVQVIQGFGDGQSRNRGGWENNQVVLGESHPMRCGLVCTGEDVVKSEASTISRMTIINLVSKSVKDTFLKMSKLQELAEDLPQLMPAYLQWFINRGLDYKKFNEEIFQVRQQNLGQVHGRIVDMVTAQTIQWKLTREFLGWQDLDAVFKQGIASVAANMSARVTEEKAGNVFMNYLNMAICTGDAYLAGTNGLPDTPHIPNATLIGWVAPEAIYLHPLKAINCVQDLHRKSTGSRLNFSDSALIDQLSELGYFLDPKDKGPKQRRIGSQRPRVLVLKKGAFDDDPSDPGEQLNAGIISSEPDSERDSDA